MTAIMAGRSRRRTVHFDLRPDNRWGWPAVRMEFGPWWHRWWLILRRGGRPHRVITGEPCVVFCAEREQP